MSDPFIAEVRMWACDFAPRGWSFCNGQELPISQNTALFSLIGTTYGGNGQTTCGLPDLTDRVPMHPGTGPGLTRRLLGEKLGSQEITLTEEQMPLHTHLLKGVSEAGSSPEPDSSLHMGQDKTSPIENISYLSSDTADLNTMLSSSALENSGGGLPHNNMQPFLGINFCIALEGVFPSRS